MNAETKAAQTVGDYDIRGPDFETLLVGPVTARIIDAARLVRGEWQNGFPNWALYRVVLAGDTHLRLPLRDFCVAYAVAHCAAGGVRTGLPVDELGCLAGWDAFYALLHHRWVIAGVDIADVAGVDPKTYRRVRAHVYRNLRGSLDEYWIRMQVAIRQVAILERQSGREASPALWRPAIKGGANPYERALTDGDGNYRALPLIPG